MKNKIMRQTGFTIIEMMVVIAILAILALISVPSSLGKIVRENVSAGLPLADSAKEPIAAIWKAEMVLAADNETVGLPEPKKVVSNFISSLAVIDGVIHMTFGNKAHGKLTGKVLSMRPAVIEGSAAVPITWVCGYAKAPEQMVVKGVSLTNIEREFLPRMCK